MVGLRPGNGRRFSLRLDLPVSRIGGSLRRAVGRETTLQVPGRESLPPRLGRSEAEGQAQEVERERLVAQIEAIPVSVEIELHPEAHEVEGTRREPAELGYVPGPVHERMEHVGVARAVVRG